MKRAFRVSSNADTIDIFNNFQALGVLVVLCFAIDPAADSA